jgi:hypothetical protein
MPEGKPVGYIGTTVETGRLGPQTVNIDGVEHVVTVSYEGPHYLFSVDGGSQMQCDGHPVDIPQGPGIPSAAEIAIRVGPGKPSNIHWAGYWRNKESYTQRQRRQK